MKQTGTSVAEINVEPDTLHRRGHWFKSSIAHHIARLSIVYRFVNLC